MFVSDGQNLALTGKIILLNKEIFKLLWFRVGFTKLIEFKSLHYLTLASSVWYKNIHKI